ncbi:MAG: hypothetical protein AAF652_19185 [Cyanobacteria bacterium P01_C01_bin.72]
MESKDTEKSVVVKTDISSQLKLDFKILCVQQETTMSLMIERLVRNWLAETSFIARQSSSASQTNLEVVGIYLPMSLKVELKVLCMQRRISMKRVLAQLIEEWVAANLYSLPA